MFSFCTLDPTNCVAAPINQNIPKTREKWTYHLALEQHRSEPCGSTYTVFPIQCATINVFTLPYDFLSNSCSSLADFIVRIRCIIHIIYKTRVHPLPMLPVGLLVDRRLLVKLWGVKSSTGISNRAGIGASNPCYSWANCRYQIPGARSQATHSEWKTHFFESIF